MPLQVDVSEDFLELLLAEYLGPLLLENGILFARLVRIDRADG
jgi:hypothetical protein